MSNDGLLASIMPGEILREDFFDQRRWLAGMGNGDVYAFMLFGNRW